MASLSEYQPDEQAAYPGWGDLLMQAVMQPGKLHDGYRFFHDYSVGNQQLALAQCFLRGIEPGPIATYNRWQERGRQVPKGQKALVLYMPLAISKDRNGQPFPEGTDGYVIFKALARWFVYSQTDPMDGWQGPPWEADPLPEWDRDRALAALDVTEVPFTHMNGNTQGYCLPKTRELAINPVAVYPYKTTFHELGHIILQSEHSQDKCSSEVEAELTAYLVCHTLGVDLAGLESGRAYVQHYLGAYLLDDAIAKRVFRAANAIIEKGHPEKAKPAGRPDRPKTVARSQSSRRGKRNPAARRLERAG